MLEQRLVIPGRLPGLNEMINENRKSKYKGNSLKQEYTEYCQALIYSQELQPIQGKAFFEFFWFEVPNRGKLRDKDNIAAGGRKVIFDALTRADILKDDNWDNIEGWTDKFFIAKSKNLQEVLVVITDLNEVENKT